MVTNAGQILDMRLQVDVTEENKIWLKVRAARTGITMAEMVDEALNDYRQKIEAQESTDSSPKKK